MAVWCRNTSISEPQVFDCEAFKDVLDLAKMAGWKPAEPYEVPGDKDPEEFFEGNGPYVDRVFPKSEAHALADSLDRAVTLYPDQLPIFDDGPRKVLREFAEFCREGEFEAYENVWPGDL